LLLLARNARAPQKGLLGARTPRHPQPADVCQEQRFSRPGYLISSAVRAMCRLIEYGSHLCLPEIPFKSGGLRTREPQGCSLPCSVGSFMSRLIAAGPSMNLIRRRDFFYTSSGGSFRLRVLFLVVSTGSTPDLTTVGCPRRPLGLTCQIKTSVSQPLRPIIF
jgi:hypothetical protein